MKIILQKSQRYKFAWCFNVYKKSCFNGLFMLPTQYQQQQMWGKGVGNEVFQEATIANTILV